MRTTIAVLSDVHGVLPALEAVLAEPDVAAADAIIVTGDVAAGPQPAETLDALASLGERVAYVRGNADRELFDHDPANPPPYAVSDWAARQLREDQKTWMRTWPATLTLDVQGLGRVLFCHATPRDDEEMVLVDSGYPRWREVTVDVASDVDVIVCGNTHMPFTRLVDNRWVVNPGSIGMPYGPPGAYWALLGPGGIGLRRTRLDADAVCAAVTAGSTFPEVAGFCDEYLRGRYSDADAHEVFAPTEPGRVIPA